jgi:hypothetical protein
MKTTFYELTRAVKKVWGFDPYDGDVESDYVIERDGEGSIVDVMDRGYIYFKILGDKFQNNYEIDDWNIEITETDGADEILEAL